MARVLRRLPKGFTLVELLIVVAIIGVLSTIGIPTFRRMVAKAKKSEAKVALGGLFTVESAFRTEYNTYGSRLSRVGFEIEGGQRLYTVGFPTAACVSIGQIEPSEAQTIGTLNLQYPTYSTGTDLLEDGVTDSGIQLTVSARNLGSQTVSTAGGGTAASQTCMVTNLAGTLVNVAANGTTFVASATGAITPGVQTNDVATTGCVSKGGAGAVRCQDAWSIDERRRLVNDIDGAQ